MSALNQIGNSKAYFCVASLLLLAACANRQEANEEAADNLAVDSAPAQRTAAVTASREAGALMPTQRVIHFAFDDSNVGPSYQQMLIAHGRYLADNGDVSLRLEGHADERGSREYNVGLGARRANAVRQLLLLQGATDGQIEILSFGEERPSVAASNESAWQQNRRVEFNYAPE